MGVVVSAAAGWRKRAFGLCAGIWLGVCGPQVVVASLYHGELKEVFVRRCVGAPLDGRLPLVHPTAPPRTSKAAQRIPSGGHGSTKPAPAATLLGGTAAWPAHHDVAARLGSPRRLVAPLVPRRGGDVWRSDAGQRGGPTRPQVDRARRLRTLPGESGRGSGRVSRRRLVPWQAGARRRRLAFSVVHAAAAGEDIVDRGLLLPTAATPRRRVKGRRGADGAYRGVPADG